MSEKFSQRFAWALEVLNVQPDDHLLEIGCGTGLLAIQIAHLIEKGKSPLLINQKHKLKKE